jgi:plasmid maintenance system antidote protein VapI
MEQLGYKQKDLAEVMGLKRNVSEILNRKQKLTLKTQTKFKRGIGNLHGYTGKILLGKCKIDFHLNF